MLSINTLQSATFGTGGQAQDSTHLALSKDTSEVNIRVFTEGQIEAFKNNADYDYSSGSRSVDSIWDQLLFWLQDLITRFFPNGVEEQGWDTLGWLLRGFFYLAIAALVVWGIMQVTGIQIPLFRKPKRVQKQVVFEPLDAPISSIDFEALAREATENDNNSLAVRYYYLHMLKLFDQHGLIVWQPQKTNQDYLRECNDTLHGSSLRQLTYMFDYAWYGAFPVGTEMLNEARRLSLQSGQRLESQ